MSRHTMIILAVAALVAAGCGASAPSKPAPGTPGNPLVAKTTAPDEPDNTKAPPLKPGGKAGGGATGGGATAAKGTGSKGTGSKGGSKGGSTARQNTAQLTGEPGYQTLVTRQSHKPKSRFTPCNLVSASEARVLMGAPVQEPFEAPQGPTCIYRGQRGKPFVTVAVQAVGLKALKPSIHRPRHVAIDSRAGLCSSGPSPALFVPIRAGRVLVVGASCGLAKAFALKALPHL